ncbi:MAG: hypothetical protein V7676_18440 [Parasphingorhabdus sp.]|uniref:hypothetical protein n=1 Tax=Parasphingorhabdus sp. TaxID=2709688 RepID=UPI0030035AD6
MLPEQTPQTPGLTGSMSEELQEKIAAELDRIHHDLEQIGVSLCGDMEMAERHCEPLQRLDELGQRSFWLAKLLRTDNPVELINNITLGSLSSRLVG